MIGEVARREIRTRIRTRAFKIATSILVLAALAGPLAVVLWPEGQDTRAVVIGIVDAPPGAADVISALGTDIGLEITFENVRDASEADLDAALATGAVDVVVVSPTSLRWLAEADLSVRSVLAAVLQQAEVVDGLRGLGLGAAEIDSVLQAPEIIDEYVEPATSQENLASGLAFAGLLLAFVAAQFVGQLSMMGVVEEKSTGVVEVLLGHVRPHVLLTGKVLGLTAVALSQILIVLSGLAAALALAQTDDVPTAVWRFLPVLLLTLIIGMVTYASLFALLGSLVSRQEDASQVVFPAMLPLFLGYVAGQYFAFEDASSISARVLTFFPLTTPMLLPVRVARDAIGSVEFVAALVVMACWLAVMLRLAGRVYSFTLLRSGTRVPWREVARLIAGR